MRLPGCLVCSTLTSPDIAGYEVDFVVTFQDLEEFYELRHSTVCYTFHCQDAVVSLGFKRPQRSLRFGMGDCPNKYTLVYCGVSIPDTEGFVPVSDQMRRISFKQKLGNVKVQIKRDCPLRLTMSQWDVVEPYSNEANIVPRRFIINGIRYLPAERQSSFGLYESAEPAK